MRHYLVKDQKKRELILETLINKWTKFNTNNLDYELDGTTFNLYIVQKTYNTFEEKSKETKQLIAQCYLVKNKFYLKYVDEEGNIKEFSTPLLQLRNYCFPGFLNYQGMSLYEQFNSIRLAYCTLVTRSTWIYDCHKEFDILKDHSFTINLDYILDSQPKMVSRLDESIHLPVLTINDYPVAKFKYNLIKSYRQDSTIGVSIIEFTSHLRNERIDNFRNDKLLHFKSIKEYLERIGIGRELLSIKGVQLNRLLNLSFASRCAVYYSQFKKDNINWTDICFLHKNYNTLISLSEDINNMLDDMDFKSYVLSPKVNKWKRYHKSFKELKFKDLSKLQDAHDSLVVYYNVYLEEYRKKKSFLENKETNEKLCKIYNDNHPLVNLVKFIGGDCRLLKYSEDFVDEGRKQNNCVASYIDTVLRNRNQNYGIIHYKECTIELLDFTIRQCKGHSNVNKPIIEKELKVLIKEYINNTALSFEDYPSIAYAC